ncbi:MAG TPA: phosphoglycerate mutase, partial [Pirellulaceae bacterium]
IHRGNGHPAPYTRETRTTAPHDLTDQSIRDAYPRGPGSELLTELMERSASVFADHPVNLDRRARGLRTASHIWLWGLGQAPQLAPFQERFGLRGAMITAVDLLRGLARLVGWDVLDVPGATGYLDTDYAAKGRHALAALDQYDIVCVHVEATDEASHEGRADAKVEALEQIDANIVSPLWEALRVGGDHRMWITPDHPTFLRTKMHSRGMVPWTMAGTGIQPDAATSYDEAAATRGKHHFSEGSQQMEFFVLESSSCP